MPLIEATDDEILALKALHHGNASETQQKAALRWFIVRAAQTHGEIFTADDSVTNYLAGRRSVGLAALRFIELKQQEKAGNTNG